MTLTHTTETSSRWLRRFVSDWGCPAALKREIENISKTPQQSQNYETSVPLQRFYFSQCNTTVPSNHEICYVLISEYSYIHRAMLALSIWNSFCVGISPNTKDRNFHKGSHKPTMVVLAVPVSATGQRGLDASISFRDSAHVTLEATFVAWLVCCKPGNISASSCTK